MWKSRTKTDLIIEVWEALDCESVGAEEIEAIGEAVRGQFGEGAVESPMIIARMLADEGAELRHSEIMELYVKHRANSPYDAMFRNILNLSDLKQALSSIRNLENLRKKLTAENDRNGLRLVRETVLKAKLNTRSAAENEKFEKAKRDENAEIAEWFTIWMQTPEIFESWVELRQNSKEFKEKFG
jgi:hypothetical protein